MLNNSNLASTPLAGIYGALLGDALGVPHEFKLAHQIPAARELRMTMPSEYQKTYSGIPYGTWSDDGSQLLCLIESLEASQGAFDAADFAARLVRWYSAGYHQAGGKVFDCGAQTRHAIERIQSGGPAIAARSTDARGCGNGSLMRCLPIALAPALWPETAGEVISAAMTQSRLTHAHPVAQVTCALYAEIAHALADSEPAIWDERVICAEQALRRHPDISSDPELIGALDKVMAGRREMPTGSGYCVSTLWSAIWALERSGDYASAVRLAISLGGDTDTLACVCGGLAGLVYGARGLPGEWIDALVVPAESRALLERMAGIAGPEAGGEGRGSSINPCQ